MLKSNFAAFIIILFSVWGPKIGLLDTSIIVPLIYLFLTIIIFNGYKYQYGHIILVFFHIALISYVAVIFIINYGSNPDTNLILRALRALVSTVVLGLIFYNTKIKIDSFVKIREKLLTEDFLDFLCFADSYGALTPDYVKKIMTLFRNMNPNVLIGFHSHDNMSLSMANTITAIENGADMVDGTYTGIGRGGGNLRLELITLYLTLNKGYLFSLVELFEYLDTYITDESRKKRTTQLN